MGAVARLGDMSDHAGFAITASGDVLVNGIGVVRKGDMHACPVPGHGTTPFITASIKTNANGRGIVSVGIGQASCGAKMVTGSPTVNAG